MVGECILLARAVSESGQHSTSFIVVSCFEGNVLVVAALSVMYCTYYNILSSAWICKHDSSPTVLELMFNCTHGKHCLLMCATVQAQ